MIENCEKYKRFIEARGVDVKSRGSYVSYLNRVQRELGIQINSEILASIDDLENLSQKVREKKCKQKDKKQLQNGYEALRRYGPKCLNHCGDRWD